MEDKRPGRADGDADTEAPSEGARRRKRKLILFAAPALLAATVASAVFVYARYGMSGSGDEADGINKYIAAESEITPIYVDNKQETAFLCGTSVLGERIGGDGAQLYASSDGSRAVVLCGGGDVYAISDGNVVPIGSEAVSAGISFSGRRAYFIDAYDKLWTVELDTMEATVAAEDIAPEYGIAVSPGGERMMYCRETEVGVVLYAYRNGRSEIFARDFYPVSISDGGRYIYLRRGEGELYGARLGSDGMTKLASGVDFSDCTLNADGSEIIYRSGSDCYIAVDCMNTYRLCEMKSFTVLLPDGCVSGTYQPVKTLIGTAVCYKDSVSELSVGFLDAEYGFRVIAKSIDSASTNLAGDAVYYLFRGTLYGASLTAGETPEALAEDVGSFMLSESGAYIYCTVGEAGDLCRISTVDPEPQTVTLAYGISGFDVIGEDVVYVKDSEDGGLYFCGGTETPSKIRDGRVTLLNLGVPGIVIFGDENGGVFVSENGVDFESVEL